MELTALNPELRNHLKTHRNIITTVELKRLVRRWEEMGFLSVCQTCLEAAKQLGVDISEASPSVRYYQDGEKVV